MSPERVIVPIVEGHGEIEAVPVLVRRVANDLSPEMQVRVVKPIRVPKGRLLKESEFERYLSLAGGQVETLGGVLVVLDADDTCPAEEAPKLMARAEAALYGIQCGVVLAKHEFEAWFIAGADSLRGRRGLPADLIAPDDPEAVRGAKEWLSGSMAGSHTYSPAVDQAALTAVLDLDLARFRSPSFDKCLREVERLLR